MIAQRANSEAQRANSEMPNGLIICHLREYLHKNTYNTYKSVGLLLFLLFLDLSRSHVQQPQAHTEATEVANYKYYCS
jgi:hypothetical protein